MLIVYRSNGPALDGVTHLRVGTDVESRKVVLSIVQADGEELAVPLEDVTSIRSDADKLAALVAQETR